MIHIATVHWQTDEWIDVQLKYLKRFIKEPFQVYAFLNAIPKKHNEKFYFVCTEPIEDHGIKLNILAQIINLRANDNDILIFLDGDAFPIAPLDSFLTTTLAKYPLAAIARTENLGDRHPHPSFCATTIGFWNSIAGDWKMGYSWVDNSGMLVSDTGANLWQKLEENNTHWIPLYRTSSLTDHSLWYGIYHSLVYHHGAGFRSPAERNEISKGPFWMKLLWLSISKSRSLTVILNRIWEKALDKHVASNNYLAHKNIFNRIQKENNFFDNCI